MPENPEKSEKSGTMYAQTIIQAGEDEPIQPGDTVTAQTKGIGGKAGFEQLVESGAVGPEKPEETAPTGTTIGAAATVEELEEARVSQPASPTRSGS
jgi:hypothetical protein